jgi:hypothetical protein
LQNGREALVLQPRDRLLLRNLALLRILDRRQIEQLAGFHSISRVNVRLARLRNAGLIVRYFTATSTGSRCSIFSLSKRGAHEAETTFVPMRWRPDAFLLGNAFVAHQLALADLYIAASRKEIRWQQPSSPLSPAVRLIPDAYIEDSQRSFFLEMDLGTETLAVWTQKVAAYLKLATTGEFRRIVPHPHFAVLVVADSNVRLMALRRHIAKQTQKLFWYCTLDIIMRQGFWSASWLRATGDDRTLPGA